MSRPIGAEASVWRTPEGERAVIRLVRRTPAGGRATIAPLEYTDARRLADEIHDACDAHEATHREGEPHA